MKYLILSCLLLCGVTLSGCASEEETTSSTTTTTTGNAPIESTVQPAAMPNAVGH